MNAADGSLGEGDTPVIELPAVAERAGLPRVWAKAEWMNPTGSYKDRIAAATMRAAIGRGARGWVGTSSGNGGAAMAAFGARSGLPGFLCVAADAPAEKLASIVPYGTSMLPMTELGPTEMDAIERLADEFGLQLAITAYRYNPVGMAGAEAIGEELARQGPFTHVYVPTGGGGLLCAVARGLARSASDAEAAAPPRVVVAQPAGCAPVARHVEGELDAPRVGGCTSLVSGLQLPDPPDGVLAAEAVRASGGWGCSVTDDATWAAQELLARGDGVFVEPASALAVAAILADVASGRLTAADRPVAVLTGSGLKDLRRFAATSREPPLGIADLRELLARSLA